jgi:hypothetical protein
MIVVRILIERTFHKGGKPMRAEADLAALKFEQPRDYQVGDRIFAAPNEDPHPPWRVLNRIWSGDDLTLTVSEVVEVPDAV